MVTQPVSPLTDIGRTESPKNNPRVRHAVGNAAQAPARDGTAGGGDWLGEWIEPAKPVVDPKKRIKGG